MGTNQAFIGGSEQGNITSNNARSVDDCSPRGLGLQRKASVANNTESLNGLKNGEEFDNAPLLRKSLSNVIRQNKMTSSIVQRESKKGVAQGVLLRDDEACIESFANDVYEEKNYEAGKFGHFKAKYTPGSRNLDVTLPVRYENSMNLLNSEQKSRKDFFEGNIRKTWSSRGCNHHINFRRSRSEVPATPSKGWESKLNGTKVNVEVVDAEKTNQTAFFDLRTVPEKSGVNRGVAKLRENSFEDNSVVDRRERKRVGNKTKLYPSWNPTAHEAGHMFGLGDEYRVKNRLDDYTTSTGKVKKYYYYTDTTLRAVDNEGHLQTYNLSTQSRIDHSGERYTVGKSRKGYYLTDASGERLGRSLDGTVSTHYDMVEDYFDENYANEHAVMHDGKGQKTDSIMNSGNKVEMHHYVTFADAMVQAIQKKFPSVPSPDAPNTRKDWTID